MRYGFVLEPFRLGFGGFYTDHRLKALADFRGFLVGWPGAGARRSRQPAVSDGDAARGQKDRKDAMPLAGDQYYPHLR